MIPGKDATNIEVSVMINLHASIFYGMLQRFERDLHERNTFSISHKKAGYLDQAN
jgi:hypothetical protein